MKKIFVFILLIAFTLILFPAVSPAAYASSVYSDVLDDLSVDENFSIDDYPINQTDYSLHFIQVAESSDNALLAYVYQPSAGKNNVLAKKLRMSVDGGQSYKDYNLTLLSRNSVFFKYKVDNYVTDYKSNQRRTYNIVQIMRSADAALGDTVVDGNNNTISYIPYNVGYTFTVIYKAGEDKIYYGKEKLEVITVTDKYCGQLQFSNDNVTDFVTQLQLGTRTSGMLHFIAFNTDRPMDDLRKADIAYTLNTYTQTNSGNLFTAIFGIDNYREYITSAEYTATLSATVQESYQGGLFGHKYTWSQIMTKENFVNNVVTNDSAFFSSDLTAAGAADIADKAWVLCFLVTDIYSMDSAYGFGSWAMKNQCSYVTDETILRLEFVTDGVLYNLGVVDNYQSGDGVPDNTEDYGFNQEYWNDLFSQLEGWFKIFLIVIGLVLLFVLIFFLIKPLRAIVKIIFKGIGYILFAPFAFIRWITGGKKKHEKQVR